MSARLTLQSGDLRYRDVCAILAHVAHPQIRPESKVRGRVQALQKQGIPAGTRSGRGRAASYSAEATWHLVFMFELSNVGVSPRRADGIVRAAWFDLLWAVRQNVGVTLALTPNRALSVHIDVPALAKIVGRHLPTEAREATKQ